MNGRFKLFVAGMGLAILWWMGYLFCVQVLDLHDLGRVRMFRYNPANHILIPKRGDIRDRNGNLLVSTIRYHQVDVERGRIVEWCEEEDRDPGETFQTVASILAAHTAQRESQILGKLQGSTSRSVQVSTRVRDDDLAAIQAAMDEAGIPGLISTFGSMRRTYSHGLLAARLLGVVTEKHPGPDELDSFYRLQGICGLEATYNEELTGEYGWKKVYRDATNQAIPHPDMKEHRHRDGYTLELTLDMEMQEILESRLREGVETYQARHGMGIIMDPDTGEVLAMAGMHAQDEHKEPGTLRSLPNLPVNFLFEPGSVLKPVTALVALEEGLFGPNDMFDCRTYRTGRRTIRDAHEFTDLSFRDVIAHSSNTGIAKVAEAIGEQKLYDRLVAMGFGHTTGSDFNGEQAGLLREVKRWSSFSLHSLSFGQEISVTTLQLGVAYCAFANGGRVLRPHIVRRILDENNEPVREFGPQVLRTVSTIAALDTLSTFLRAAVESGTGTATELSCVNVAGKTGTAEKSSHGVRGYSENLYTSSFCGYFPAEDPHLVMCIVYDEPDYKYHYGSVSAVPTFREVAEAILILPDCPIITAVSEENSAPVTMPDVLGMNQTEALSRLHKAGIQVQCLVRNETGEVLSQYPKPGVTFDAANRVLLVIDRAHAEAEPAGDKMPNLVGMSLRRALTLAQQYRLELRVQGQGVIVSQSVQPGADLPASSVCRVEAR